MEIERPDGLTFNAELAEQGYLSRKKDLRCPKCSAVLAVLWQEWETTEKAIAAVKNFINPDEPAECPYCNRGSVKFYFVYDDTDGARKKLPADMIGYLDCHFWTAKKCAKSGHSYLTMDGAGSFKVHHFEGDMDGNYTFDHTAKVKCHD